MLAHADPSQLRVIFTEGELGDPSPRALAARFAVKEACLKVFPRETGLKDLDFADIPVRLDPPRVEIAGTLARLMKRYRYRSLSVSTSGTRDHACGIVIAE